MRICMLAHQFDLHGGIGRVATELRTRMAPTNKVASMESPNGTLAGYLIFSLWDCHFRLPPADVYHAISPVEGAWLPPDRSVVTFHDLFTWTHPHLAGAGVGNSRAMRTAAAAYFHFCCSMASRARVVVCVSEHTRREVVGRLRVPPEKVRVIRSGIREDLRPVPVRHSSLRIGYLGQLDRRKRVDLLVSAFVRNPQVDAELWVGGTGMEEAKLRALAAGDSRVRFLGFIHDTDLVNFYNSLDWFVFPTAIEGYGLPPVEAMACGLPVVVLEDAIIPADIKNRCIATDDLPGLIAVLERCRPRRELLEQNREFAQSHRWDETVREYMKAYREVGL